MLYILLDNNQIKLLHLKKSLLGQYDVAFYKKEFQMNLIDDGKLVNLDFIASAVKEALLTIPTAPIKDKDVTLVLPQEIFAFFRTDMPMDIAPTILNSYLKEKARAQISFDIENAYYDYLVQENEDKKQILFFALNKDLIPQFEQPFKLLDLRISSIVPESLAYFKLFEKTLRKDKKENIFYVSYAEDLLIGHLYDSFGPMDNEKWTHQLTKKEVVEDVLKDKAVDYETQGKKLNRLILSGEQSENIRQDTFTKQVGVWTNPLKRIIPNFYQDYVKMLNPVQNESLPILEYDAVVGAFIFAMENRNFSLFNGQGAGKSSPLGGRTMPKVNIPWKRIGLFAASFVVTFGIIFALTRVDYKSLAGNVSVPGVTKPTETPTPTPPPPTETPTPTPSVDKAEIRIKILNGTGISGKAATVRTLLREKEYQNFVVGNQGNKTQITEIQIKSTMPHLKDIIIEDLKDNVEEPKVTTDLDEDDAADIIIVVGFDFK